MAAKKKTRRRRRSPLAAAPRRRRRVTTHHHKPRRRRRGLSAGGGGTKMTIVKSLKNAAGGAIGGAVYTAPKAIVALPLWGKLLWGGISSVGLTMMKYQAAGAGAAGAMTLDVAQSLLKTSLKDDGDLQDTQYVDPATLSDTGYRDQNGNAIVMDDDNVAYALNDDGHYQALCDASELEDDEGMNDGSNLQNVSMLPLSDPYSLSGNGAFALSDPYALSSGY